MQYYVIGPDGNKYGPADVPTLKQWVAENRLNPQSMLEDFSTGQRVQAGQVQGLFASDPQIAAPTAPTGGPAMGAPVTGTVYQPTAQYPRGAAVGGDDGSSDLTLAWVFGAIGLFCCAIIFCPLGIQKANSATQKGNPGGNAARIFNIVGLILWVIFVILRFTLLAGTLSSGRPSPFNP